MQHRYVTAGVVALSLGALLFAPLGCGGDGKSGSDKILEGLGPPAKKPSEIKAKEITDEERKKLEEARKKAGFKDFDEIAAENAKIFEKGAREYVKTRMKEYRALLADMRGHLDELEKEAAKWGKAKDPQKAFDKWSDGYRKKSGALVKTYDKLTGQGAEGGNTQVVLGKAFRAWEDLKGDLSPDIGADARFAEVLTEIRGGLDELEKALEDIDKDESLVVNKFYKEGKSKDDEGDEGDEDED